MKSHQINPTLPQPYARAYHLSCIRVMDYPVANTNTKEDAFQWAEGFWDAWVRVLLSSSAAAQSLTSIV